ncbi:hypothetical protein C5614_04140 [Massilia phosphatilytica]|nr:hypothetical protein C5614_04140 [Massilia phosphatilytica]
MESQSRASRERGRHCCRPLPRPCRRPRRCRRRRACRRPVPPARHCRRWWRPPRYPGRRRCRAAAAGGGDGGSTICGATLVSSMTVCAVLGRSMRSRDTKANRASTWRARTMASLGSARGGRSNAVRVRTITFSGYGGYPCYGRNAVLPMRRGCGGVPGK